MADPNSVKEEISAFLAEHNGLAKGCFPYAKLIALYKRYAEQEKILEPGKKNTEIYEEFSVLCKKNKTWMLSYTRLTKLDPELLELINVRIGPFYLSVSIASLLCNHPRQVQKKLLEKAKELAKGRQDMLRYYVDKLGGLYKKGDFLSTPPSPVPYKRLFSVAPAVEPASGTLPASCAPTPKLPSPLSKVDTFNKKSREDEIFLKFLAQTTPITTRTAEAPAKEQVREWQGDRRTIEGKKYGGSGSPTKDI